ncbi:TonB-dependent receptor [Adhaeribacter radiodurans]|uniref:Carboxypeptidase-like regulatory domain-containing protein n=1 Tax=Adhaeribacter radiodurans TaxID=2745197 RepID=A0A7L7LBI5_9BACT|nr:TonB-dependent receptor [Adhaeribacter radiodurans]QMU30196.1 carboxypeptidase-like regulatory domain-containing protein [Adhaeribacter radiodurans]
MRIYLITFLFIVFITFTTKAQQTLSGKVTAAKTQQPLIGATISVPGTSTGTTTDSRGAFTLTLPSTTDTIVVSILGYQTKYINPDTLVNNSLISLDTDFRALQEVVITGYATNRPLQQTAASVGLLTPRELERYNTTSLVPALNTLPGVRMEERATASYRLSIRGSSLRAPFGVRNVKMYLNDVPLVEANGTLPLNLLDAGTIGKIEVLKGPAGSVYGAGTGGTVRLETIRPRAGESALEIGSMVGSYGLKRYTATATTASETSGFLVRYAKQELDGYRQQSAMDRDAVLLTGQFYPSDKQTFTFHTYFSDLYYQLPGALTREQYESNPRAARQVNIDQKASLKLQGINIGLAHQYQFNEHWRNNTSLFGVFSFLNNPFTTDYERNANQAFGGRTQTTYSTLVAERLLRFTVGGEFQHSFVNSRHYQNRVGEPGKLNFDDEVAADQGFVFAQAEADLPGNFILTLGSSLNFLQYDLTRVSSADTTSNYRNRRSFNPQFSPRLGLLKVISPQLSAHGSISAGFSPPTDAEIRPSDGSFNTQLQAERGLNYEVGLRGNALKQKLVFDLVGFWFKLNETIVSRTNAAGIVVFDNAGATRQQGIEAALSYAFIQDSRKPISFLKVWSTYAYSHFRFREYRQNDSDYSGNKLTGTPPHVWLAGLDLESKPGFYLNATTNYTNKIPLNDANSVYADSYFLLGARGGIRRSLGLKWQTEIYGGIDNALDKTYSLGNDLNGFGSRYFQAAPGRNYYVGLQIKYLIRK